MDWIRRKIKLKGWYDFLHGQHTIREKKEGKERKKKK
jgi:hypothetical protein